MPTIVGIRFRKACKIYYFDPVDTGVVKGDHAIVETARGMEFGEVVLGPRQVENTNNPLKPVLRKASEEDIQKVEQNVVREQEAFHICERRIKAHELPMNLVDVEFTYDVNKIIFYFTADGRIDFRELVKDLAGIFRTRIELHQIGVRDEAKMLGGIGCCGRALCCATFLGDFEPVSIKMAKNQNLSLNPTKISGICGRLMCCLKYEDYLYSKGSRKFENPKDDAPKLGSIVACTLGEGKVVRVMRDEHQASIQLTPDNIVTVDWDEIVDPTEAVEDKAVVKPEGCANCPGCDTATGAAGAAAETAEHGRENFHRERRSRNNGERGENGGREGSREGGRDGNGRRDRRDRNNGEQGEGRSENGSRRERRNRNNGERNEGFSRDGNRDGGREGSREGGRDGNGRRDRRDRNNGEQGEGRSENGSRRERRNRNNGERNENGLRERGRDERRGNEEFKNGSEEQNGERRSRRERRNRHRNQEQNGQVAQENRGQEGNLNRPAGKHDTAVLFSLPPEELHVAPAASTAPAANPAPVANTATVHAEAVAAAPVAPANVAAPAVTPMQNATAPVASAHSETVHTEPVHAEPAHSEPVHTEHVHAEPVHAEPVHAEPVHTEAAPQVAPQLDQPAAPAVPKAPAAPISYPHHVSVNRNREQQRPHHGGYRNPWGSPERPAAEPKAEVKANAGGPTAAPEVKAKTDVQTAAATASPVAQPAAPASPVAQPAAPVSGPGTGNPAPVKPEEPQP
jgi:cell fate regulator YaaT (PSP1 superfamily)